MRKIHILLAIRPPVEGYPPSINQANLLYEKGYKVTIACGEKKGSEQETPISEGIDRVGIEDDSIRTSNIFYRAINVFKFRKKLRKTYNNLSPDIVITYDPEACWALGSLPKKNHSHLIWHFHETPTEKQRSFILNLASSFVIKNSKKPDLILFPETMRAKLFMDCSGRRDVSIKIIANCPRLVREIKKSKLRSGLNLPEKSKIILYHGSVGSTHCIEIAVRSIKAWPVDSYFVIKGHCSSDYKSYIKNIAVQMGLEERVIFVDYSTYNKDYYNFISGADICWTALNPEAGENWRYAAGASNKRFEAMALGIPQVTDTNPGVRDLIEANECGICINQNSTKEAGDAINKLLTDNQLYEKQSDNARALHLNKFNYETQFNQVLKYIEKIK